MKVKHLLIFLGTALMLAQCTLSNQIDATVTDSQPKAVTLKAGSPALGDTKARLSDGMTMVYVPGGSFMMGSTQAQIDAANALCEQYPDAWGKCAENGEAFAVEGPQHEVTLDGFWIDRTEVTYGQYALCVEDGECRPVGGGGNADDLPAAAIPWADAAAYCVWAGGRLPTEAEWEYAARGTSGSIYPWGNEFGCQYGNFSNDISKCDDGYLKASPVGSFPEGVSWCGALDMAGNVWEWVADEFREYTTQKEVNPTNPPTGNEGILRGGSWGYGPGHTRTTFRYVVPFSANYQAVGFRCVLPGSE
jgi:formylglycine-generating enzyme required for sulfatase activity